MSKVTLEDALNYISVSNIDASPSGNRVIYKTHEPVLKTNGYEHKTVLKEEDKITEIDPVFGEAVFADDETFYYAVSPEDHKTLLYKVRKGKKTLLGEVPYKLGVKAVLKDGSLLLKGRVNIAEKKQTEAAGDAEEAYRQTLLQDEDCFVIDEFPYWSDGEGVINKHRNILFLFTGDKELKQLTPDLFDVKSAALSSDEKTVLYTGGSFEVQRPLKTGLYSVELASGESKTLFEPGRADISDIAAYKDGFVFAGNLHDNGISFERGKGISFYYISKDGTVANKLDTSEISYGGSVFSDVVYGTGRQFGILGDSLYFLGTWHERVSIFKLDLRDADPVNGATDEGAKEASLEGIKITDFLPDFDGVIHDFALTKKGIWFSALNGLDHQELYFAGIDGSEQVTRESSYNTDRYGDKELSEPVKLQFEDKYGQPIIGYVLKPADYREGQKYPAILDIHGGPRGAYGSVYFHEMQYWAALGYFVFFCNPTGGTGRGVAFGKIVNGTGGSDYEDIMQFTDLVLREFPDIDPKRLGVTGGSYGGFMTNWIIGHTDRFAAAASQRSTANNITEAANKDMAPGFIRSMTEPDAPDAYEKLWDLSPLKYIGKHTVTPTLFLHSLQDYRCYHVESLQMYAALQYLNVPTRMILFKNEHHGLSRDGHPRNRLRRLREITEWMDKYLKEGKE